MSARGPALTVVLTYGRRVRCITLGASGDDWQSVRGDLGTDFLGAFDGESQTVLPLRAIVVGSDAENTGGRSLGFVADLRLHPPPSR